MNVLERIVEQKRREVDQLPTRPATVEDLRAALAARGDWRDFIGALLGPRRGPVALIAELKRASPSAGLLQPDFAPAAIACAYAAAGASCLSVLTDGQFFQGSLRDLRAVRACVGLPLLRKDFLIDERQISESIEWGADAVLLIAAILNDAQLRRLHELAVGAGLAALVEVHDEAELERALALDAQMVGINNRDLKTLKVDLAVTEHLAARLRALNHGRPRVLVAESGVHDAKDVQRLARCGVQAVLVGESLMRAKDIAAKAAELLGGPPR
jgi:indole-3-glycerol phosphate synthase